MILTKILPSVVKKCSQKMAIICQGKKFTYQQFSKRVAQLAHGLQKAGIQKNDKIAILHKNCHFFLESYFGAIHTGSVLVPINHHLSPNELAFILNDSEAKLLLSDYNFSKKIKEASSKIKQDISIIYSKNNYENFISSTHYNFPLVDIHPKDIAQIYYTSGTTRRAKGVILSHKNVSRI
jgi:acyl-CoA synthetase (AMP-forming)/AMP-acid ligase II